MVNKELPIDGNGHLYWRLGRNLLQHAYAPTGDPHESYLIKDGQGERIGRTKEFGYVCYCWRDVPDVCMGCSRKRK